MNALIPIPTIIATPLPGTKKTIGTRKTIGTKKPDTFSTDFENLARMTLTHACPSIPIYSTPLPGARHAQGQLKVKSNAGIG